MLLLDRQLPSGGCNYGNTSVLGQMLRPHVQPTCVALLALAKEQDQGSRIAKSVSWLRKALSNGYPALDDMGLEDFRVRVLDRSVGTGATVRVLIDLSNGEREWTTVGVSENIIEASWEALVDGYTYGLLHPRSAPEG